MNRGQVLAVDFEKRELKDTQQNSDNDKQSFYRNKTKICNDALLKCYVGLKGATNRTAALGPKSSTYQTNKLLADMLLEQIEYKVGEEM